MLRIDGKEYYSTKEAALRLSRTQTAIQDAIRRGSLRSTRFPGIAKQVFIEAPELERYEAEQRGSRGWKTRKAPGYVPDLTRREYQKAYRERKRAAEAGVSYMTRAGETREEGASHEQSGVERPDCEGDLPPAL